MSAICGLVNLDGRPVDEPDGVDMLGALSHRGPDGTAGWRSERVMLGHLMMRVTPESFNDVQPGHDPEARLTITAAARLDNRDQLCERLGIPPSRRQEISDSQLILSAWQAWG